MELKLYGYLAEVNKYNRMLFYFTEDSSKDKLSRHCAGDHQPFNDEYFTVKLSKKVIGVPADIIGLVGLNCVCTVKLQHYKFISKMQANVGEVVRGVNLVLLDIARG